MSEFLQIIVEQASRFQVWELIAVLLAIAYLILAVRENITCWYAAFISTCIFLVIFWQVNLLMESALQVYYLLMAIYGWYQWRQPSSSQHYLPISTWSFSMHLVIVAAVLIATGISGLLLENTSARLPWLDSFTTWGSIVTTWMVARKILENWVYWLVIDSVSIYLYLDRELYFTAILFAAYIIIIFFGLHRWIKVYRSQLMKI